MPGPSVASQLPWEGYALSGVGAEVLWTELGALLWQLEPTADGVAPGVKAGGKEHGGFGPARIRAWALGVRLT